MRRWLEVPLVSGPSVTSDGERVLFLSDVGGLPQVWSVPGRGGTPHPWFDSAERVWSVRSSPTDPNQAIVRVDAGGDEHWQLGLVERAATAKSPRLTALTANPEVIHQNLEWRPDGRRVVFTSNARDPRYFDVYECEAGTGAAPILLYQADATLGVIDADAQRILVGRANTNLDVDLLLLDGERISHLNPHEGEQTVFAAALRPDGVYAGANPGREFAALVRYRTGSTQHEFLREYPGDVELVRSDPLSGRLVLSVNRDGWSEIHLFDPDTGDDRVFNSGPRGVVAQVSWYPDGSAFAYDTNSVDGLQVYRRDLATGKERRLAGPVTLPASIPRPSARALRARDGVNVPYWEFAPRTVARGTILWVHGGPEAQARPVFDPTAQFLVSRNWRIIRPNVRGSTGYGRTYVHLDDVRRRMDSVADLKDLVDQLVRDGKAVPGRLGILGGSYGGFMVLAAATEYPDLWGAAVDLFGIANFVSFLERTGPWRRKLREAEYGSLEVDREYLESISPIHRADRIRAPLLVIHGRNDPRVPVGEAEQIAESLRRRGRSVELLVFDDEGHGLARRENRVRAAVRIVEWLETHLGGPGTSG